MPVSIEPVHLKPLLGMQPGMYLTIIYVLIIALMVFAIGFLPGILHSGKRVTFQSDFIPTTVYIDGRNIGTSPTTVFLPSGDYTVTYAYRDIVSSDFTLSVGHPVFFTWLFPRRQEAFHKLIVNDISTFRMYVEGMFSDFIGWSAITDFSETYHYPPLFTQIAETVVSQGRTSDRVAIVFEYFQAAIRHITSSTALDDAQAAMRIFENESYFTVAQTSALNADLAKTALLFNGANGSIGLNTTPFAFQRSIDAIPAIPAPVDNGNAIPSIVGFSYAGGSFVVGQSVPSDFPGVIKMGIPASVLPFSISALEISEYQWALFMQEKPYWAKENINQLLEAGMVDENYLAGIYPSTTLLSNRPIKNISWYAAFAFCEWLSGRTGLSIELPTESQWEYAAQSVSNKPYQTNLTVIADSKGPSGMLGGYWEFTADAFVPLARYLGSTSKVLQDSADIVVKGGSYLNDPNHIVAATVGVQSREACSETTGFRIVWTK